MPTGRLLDARDEPAESRRLLAQSRDALSTEGYAWADFHFDRGRAQIQDGSFQGRLWFGPGDEAIAIAGWDPAGELGRRGWIYLAEGYRTRTVLEEFLRRLEEPSAGLLPFVSWRDEIPGISPADRQEIFTRRGLTGVVRADMRFPRGLDPPPAPIDAAFPTRRLTGDDEGMIADLLYRAYEDSPERALFATTLDHREDSRRGARGILHGEVGKWLPDASFGIVEGDRLIAQTLANDFLGGLISEVDVHPAFRRKGFARRLLPLTIRALRSAGFETPRLVVTMWNPGAVQLYRREGFEFVPGGAGRVWLDLRAMGVSAPSTPAR